MRRTPRTSSILAFSVALPLALALGRSEARAEQRVARAFTETPPEPPSSGPTSAAPQPTAAELEAAAARDREARLTREPQIKSRGMVVGGGVLIGLGVVSLVASVPFFAESAGCSGDFCGFYTAFGAGFALTSVVFLGIGVPLVVAGSAKKRDVADGPAIPAAAIRIGPGSAALEWRF